MMKTIEVKLRSTDVSLMIMTMNKKHGDNSWYYLTLRRFLPWFATGYSTREPFYDRSDNSFLTAGCIEKDFLMLDFAWLNKVNYNLSGNSERIFINTDDLRQAMDNKGKEISVFAKVSPQKPHVVFPDAGEVGNPLE